MIVVDEIVEYPAAMTTDKGLPGRHWCHLQSTDQTAVGERELLAFGRRIGMQARWLQYPGMPGRVHFDLTPIKRAEAVEAGAIEIAGYAYTRARLTGPAALAEYVAMLPPVDQRPE